MKAVGGTGPVGAEARAKCCERWVIQPRKSPIRWAKQTRGQLGRLTGLEKQGQVALEPSVPTLHGEHATRVGGLEWPFTGSHQTQHHPGPPAHPLRPPLLFPGVVHNRFLGCSVPLRLTGSTVLRHVRQADATATYRALTPCQGEVWNLDTWPRFVRPPCWADLAGELLVLGARPAP